MGNVGLPEILVIAVVGLLIFGPQRLPEMARQAGRALNEFKRVTGELTEELKAGLDEPVQHPVPAVSPSDNGALTGTEILPMQEIPPSGRNSGAGETAVQDWKDPPPGKDV